jgi:hypothetical protein
MLRAEQRRTATGDRGDMLHDEQGEELSDAEVTAPVLAERVLPERRQ